MDLEKVKRVGIAAAYQGAEILRSRFGRISQVDKKGGIDLVTEADIGSEEKIVSVIQTAFPDHTILAEESGTLCQMPESRAGHSKAGIRRAGSMLCGLWAL